MGLRTHADLAQLLTDLLEGLVQVLDYLDPVSLCGTAVEWWEDKEFIYLEVPLPREPVPEIDICLHESRVFIRMERSPDGVCLVGREESNARNSEPMFLNPLPHLLARPRPFERMGVQPIVLRPGLPNVIDEFGPTVPRSSFQVVVTEGADQQLRLLEPRGVDRGEATPPPAGVSR